ncbi:hypothetical protein F4809DRAFT_404976 [Biscogniauxia mediterranea]|nr:hypothetical protein F4809DRAFT_404976 [Biscogniauxia mediterranea]
MTSESNNEPLQTGIDKEADGLRPIVTDLNNDSSWLISIPRPATERTETGRTYYHIVLDPWLASVPGYFLTSWIGWFNRREPAAFLDGAAVDGLVREIEEAASSAAHADASVDALCVSFLAPDHMHYDTLKTFAPSIPVFAAPGPARVIPYWGHFERVVPMAAFQKPAWQSAHPGAPLPGWLTMLYINAAMTCYGVGIVWSHDDVHEALLYYPHGCDVDNDPSSWEFLEASPPPRPLALLHPVKETYRRSSMLTSGVRGGIQFWRKAKPAYWVSTGNRPLEYGGPFYWGIRDEERSLDWALEMEKEESKGQSALLDRPNLVEKGNGKQYVLA